ncbi:hypothetical protein T4B_2380 [Trichinella pseudospiralis]|uniref:Uncharacterized protein n=2 Tax=Trichinella pseudospiralis TaxID=6337 RepID=A0A0V1IZJ6_TRIPS|nr:hypothetical protein T4A_11878 [Trichinella pseudospiralis]KRY90479.1 hypothetical protein T4D_2964 [Trichinella pseudospiralis]KRZ21192.1 hypothetical protein T4B_2380 [Trichinella pseudospiralis]KRZ28076.1 hypothetical protein T4C_196 [Trichinella pseudospiralis]
MTIGQLEEHNLENVSSLFCAINADRCCHFIGSKNDFCTVCSVQYFTCGRIQEEKDFKGI